MWHGKPSQRWWRRLGEATPTLLPLRPGLGSSSAALPPQALRLRGAQESCSLPSVYKGKLALSSGRVKEEGGPLGKAY